MHETSGNPCLNRCSCHLESQNLPCRNTQRIHLCLYKPVHKENTKCVRPGLRRKNGTDYTPVLIDQCEEVLKSFNAHQRM